MRHVWVMEMFLKGKWVALLTADKNREGVRKSARYWRAAKKEVRVRKYIPEAK
jgi:hypothetical protein